MSEMTCNRVINGFSFLFARSGGPSVIIPENPGHQSNPWRDVGIWEFQTQLVMSGNNLLHFEDSDLVSHVFASNTVKSHSQHSRLRRSRMGNQISRLIRWDLPCAQVEPKFDSSRLPGAAHAFRKSDRKFGRRVRELKSLRRFAHQSANSSSVTCCFRMAKLLLSLLEKVFEIQLRETEEGYSIPVRCHDS
jgi:hypothetical protein